eukprot:1156123-Pelagomonas_calceolata.AAC.3
MMSWLSRYLQWSKHCYKHLTKGAVLQKAVLQKDLCSMNEGSKPCESTLPLHVQPTVARVVKRHADTCVLVAAFRAEDLHTPRGLATVARALRTLFALSTSGTAPGR